MQGVFGAELTRFKVIDLWALFLCQVHVNDREVMVGGRGWARERRGEVGRGSGGGGSGEGGGGEGGEWGRGGGGGRGGEGKGGGVGRGEGGGRGGGDGLCLGPTDQLCRRVFNLSDPKLSTILSFFQNLHGNVFRGPVSL